MLLMDPSGQWMRDEASAANAIALTVSAAAAGRESAGAHKICALLNNPRAA
jgi:hypothetical protein